MKRILELFLVLCCFSITIFSQPVSPGDSEITELIQNVQAKAKNHRIAFLSEYQHNSKYIIESANSKEPESFVFEQYCLNDGKPLCQMVLIEQNGAAVPESEIQKERQKAARKLSKSEKNTEMNDSFGYGTMAANVWIDPTVYLRNCQVTSFEKTVVSDRETAVVNVENCSIDRETAKSKSVISFIPMTKATIWIDMKDESVTQMYVYDKDSAKREPLIKMENTRMPEGLWLFKTIRLEAIGNEKIFTKLKNNYQYELFNYKRLSVDAKESKLTAN